MFVLLISWYTEYKFNLFTMSTIITQVISKYPDMPFYYFFGSYQDRELLYISLKG